MEILISTAVVAVIGLLVGVALVNAEKKFAVERDEREVQVREALPGNNCGACGYAGCDAMAEAIAHSEGELPVCPICTQDALKKIADIMGTQAGTAVKRVAYVHCSGTCEQTQKRGSYVGIDDCRAAKLSGLNVGSCAYGCLGMGSCVKACTFDALHIAGGIAVVNTEKCTGCGNCMKACPQNLIALKPKEKTTYTVRCGSHDAGAVVRKSCKAGCIGCGLCTKQCEYGAITISGNLAQIDPERCTACGKCAEKCPAKVIVKRG